MWMAGILVAKIALNAATYAIDKPYDYTVPEEVADTMRPGMRVVVPFGAGNRHTEGIVLTLEADRLLYEAKQKGKDQFVLSGRKDIC